MSGKNRRNNQQRNPEVDQTITQVQCDGLVSKLCIKLKTISMYFTVNC